MKGRHASLGLALGAALAVTGVARAQDVDRIVNGGFDTDLAGWAVVAFDASTGAWSALDAGGSGTSGSVRTEMIYEGPGHANAVSLSQCVAAAPGRPHSFGAWIRRQAGSDDGQSFVRVQWYASSDCSDPPFDNSDVGAFQPDDTWVLAQLVDVVPPDAARSGRFHLVNLSQDVSAPRVVFFDDAFFVPEPGLASGGVVALTALAGLCRRRA
jgi:hypothetical protein